MLIRAATSEPGQRRLTVGDQTLLISPFAVIAEGEDPGTAVVWHSLFGRPLVVSSATALRLTGRRTDDHQRPKDLSTSAEIAELEARGIVSRAPRDDRAELEARVRQHESRVVGGTIVRYLRLSVVDDCNLSCTYCIHRPAETGTPQSAPRRMTHDTARRAVDRFLALLRDQGETKAHVCFDGGEPLLNRELVFDTMEYCRRACGDDTEIRFVLATNGLLINEDVARRLKTYDVALGLSLDGTQRSNDRGRVYASGKGTYSSVVSKIDLLRRVGFPLTGLSATITRDNIDLIDSDFVELARSHQMSWLRFDPDGLGMIGADASSVATKLIALWDHCADAGIEVVGWWPRPAANLMASNDGDEFVSFCLAGRGEVVSVRTDEALVTCPHSCAVVGHLEDGFGELFGAPSRYQAYVSESLAGRLSGCRGCEIEGLCAGGCCVGREQNLIEGHSLDPVTCEIYRRCTRALVPRLLAAEGRVKA